MKFEKIQYSFGDTLKDKITGFSGKATGVAHYITGCRQVCLAAPVDKDGKLPDAMWFDLERLELVAGVTATDTVKSTPAGGPSGRESAAPVR